MMRTTLAVPALALALSLAACSKGESPPERDVAAQSTGAATRATATEPAVAATPAPDTAAPGRQHQYTSIANCRIVKEERAEMPYIERECAGPGAFTLRISDSDARQRITLIGPSSEPIDLPLNRIGGGGFSSFGQTAEWRGPAGAPFAPDSLIVRFDVAEQPNPAPETSYLLVARLGRDPCLVAIVPPGPDQNDSARARADAPGACLPG